MASHDIVAQRDYLPKLGEIPFEVDEDEDTIKIVQLVKSQDGTVRISNRSQRRINTGAENLC